MAADKTFFFFSFFMFCFYVQPIWVRKWPDPWSLRPQIRLGVILKVSCHIQSLLTIKDFLYIQLSLPTANFPLEESVDACQLQFLKPASSQNSLMAIDPFRVILARDLKISPITIDCGILRGEIYSFSSEYTPSLSTWYACNFTEFFQWFNDV